MEGYAELYASGIPRKRMRAHVKRALLVLLLHTIILLFSAQSATAQQSLSQQATQDRSMSNQTDGARRASTQQPFGFAIHGGAGTILKSQMTPELEESYRAKLREALMAGYEILKNGGAALDAVVAAIRIMEDSPLFNAGKGAVLTSAGTVELDASIMDGRTLKAGAVAEIKHVKNPISLARLVMEQTTHLLLVGEGAEAFARERGLELVPQEYFITERRQKELQREKEKQKQQQAAPPRNDGAGASSFVFDPSKYGTVGAVALDKAGNLAAGTSTGGKSNKMVGRVGDTPIIGAGNYANNQTCAVSGTGDGEYFIRLVAAYDISALMQYRGLSLKEAARTVVFDKLKKLGGGGGLIAIDRAGHITMPFNTEGMYRAAVGADGRVVVEIYKDQPTP